MPSRLHVHSIKNISGGIELLDLKMPIEILEYSDQDLIVNLPSQLRDGVLVAMKLKFFINNELSESTATGKIVSSTTISTPESEPKIYRTKIHLSQIDNKIWERFLSKCRQKQGRADKVFSSIKGDS